MSTTPATGTTGAPHGGAPKKSNKMLMIIIAAVLLAGGGGAGAYFYISKSKAAASTESSKEGKEGAGKKKSSKEDEESEGEAEEEEAGDGEHEKKDKGNSKAFSFPNDSEVTKVIELQPYIVNLIDKDEPRYLRLTVSLGLGGEEEGEEKPNPIFTTRIRNALLAVLTTKTSEEVLSLEGKAQLRKELLRAARAVCKEPKVQAIYITEFIVQM